jgi:hypothetical protein
MLKLLHSVLVHKVLIREHGLLGVILVDVSSKALLGSKGGHNWSLDRNRHLHEIGRLKFDDVWMIDVEYL